MTASVNMMVVCDEYMGLRTKKPAGGRTEKGEGKASFMLLKFISCCVCELQHS